MDLKTIAEYFGIAESTLRYKINNDLKRADESWSASYIDIAFFFITVYNN